MTTQYDDIGVKYEEIRDLHISKPTDANVEAAVQPFIKGAKVLDLACGTGYYFQKFLSWGAKKVVGVDISKGMIKAAKATSANMDELTFYVADCSIPVRYEDGSFDVVFRAWLLDYASNG